MTGPYYFQNQEKMGLLDCGSDKVNEEVHVSPQRRVTPQRHKWYLDTDNYLWTEQQFTPLASSGECKMLKAKRLKQHLT